jgi:hypothetical protein
MPSYDSLPFPLSFSSLSIYPVLFFRPSSVHPSIIPPPPFFFFLFASFRILTPHSIGGLLFSREGWVQVLSPRRLRSALVAAAARRRWTWAWRGGRC